MFPQGVGLKSSTSAQSDAVKSASFALYSKFGKEVGVSLERRAGLQIDSSAATDAAFLARCA